MNSSSLRLTTQALVVYSAWLLVGILGMLFPALLLPWLIALPFWFIWVVYDRRTVMRAGDITVQVSGVHQPELHQNFDFVLSVSSPAQFHPPDSRMLDFHSDCIIASSSVSFPVQAVRVGFETLNSLRVSSRSRSGFWLSEFEAQFPPFSFRVSPKRRQMPPENFQMLLHQQGFSLQGLRQLLRARSRDYFHSIRDYRFPDPANYIDPKKSAKFQHPMVRVYDTQESHNVVIALDVGRSLSGAVGGSARFEYYLSASLALIEDAIRAQDTVSFVAFGQKAYCTIPRARKLGAFQTLFRGDDAVRPREEESNYELLGRLVNELSGQRSLVMVLSDLSRPGNQRSFLQTLPAICHKHLVVLVGLLDQRFDADERLVSFNPKENLNKQLWELFYSYWILDEYRSFTTQVRGLGARALQLPEEYWMHSVSKVYQLLRMNG